MTFAHDDAEFGDLVRVVAGETGLSPGLVEKDYWVTHTLWALHEVGLEVWFKGGTSLSKGFQLIQRFSEDLDLKIEPGSVGSVPAVSSWTSEGTKAVEKRRQFFRALSKAARVPGATVRLDADKLERNALARSAEVRVEYPGQFLGDLGTTFRPFVLLEVGSARVTPFVLRPLSSFLHDYLEGRGQLDEFDENRPGRVQCVHPLVTLLEKLDAISKRYDRAGFEPEEFVRHYDDAARIVAAGKKLPSLEMSIAELARDMTGKKQIKRPPKADDPAFLLEDSAKKAALERAHEAIGPMFWGKRLPLRGACAEIRKWLEESLGAGR